MPEGGDLVVDWELENYAYPHDAVADPSGLGVIVAETLEARILWIEPGDESVHTSLDATHADWDYNNPNSLDLVKRNGRHYLLMSNRGNDAGDSSGSAVDGTLVLWDITEASAPDLIWTYPKSGTLGMPHSPVLRRVQGVWVLAYAHTIAVRVDGNGGQGAVGLASTQKLTKRPTYLGDGLLPTDLGDIENTRGVDLGTDGRLYFSESGFSEDGTQASPSRLITATLPALTAPGLSGAYTEGHENQAFITLEDAKVLADDLSGSFEPRLWTPSY
jgi:hypothetical protein